MTAYLKTLPRRALTIIGFMLLVVAFPQLMWKASEAEKYYWRARPLLDQLIAAQSGREEAPAIPVVEFEDRVRLTLSRNELEQGWSIKTLRLMVMAGLLIAPLGLIVERRGSGSRSGSPGTSNSDLNSSSDQC